MNEIVLTSATHQRRLLKAGKISVSELAEAHIEQIGRVDPLVNAYADFDADRVRDQALLLDRSGDRNLPLYGLPVSVKSSIAVRGYRREIGSRIHQDSRPREDAEVVARLRAAGALILGTTNCPEFLMAYETDNSLHGRTNNPWNLAYTAGGSSGGESAAIAAGMSSCGLGSDSGGSVRQPAHFTGICSLKPTPGRIPGRGHLPPCVGPFSTLGAIGPMARTIKDVTLLFDSLGGHDALDPVSAPVIRRAAKLNELRVQTIGFFEDDGLVGVTAETRAAIRDATGALREAGFRVEPFRPRELELLRKLWWTFFVRCGAMFYRSTIEGREERLSPIFREFLGFAQEAGELSTTELLDAWAELDLVRGRVLEEMTAYPLVLCPVASIGAFKHGERGWQVEDSDGRRQTVGYLDAMRHTQWWNVMGAPAAVVPVGWTAIGKDGLEGMPTGVQIAGRPYHDEEVLELAGVLDEAFGYRAPPLARG